jgi:hypothetical protein
MTTSSSFETENYKVSYYPADPNRLIISFASAGLNGAGEPIEEFRKTLSTTGASTIFVIDRKTFWYNHDDTEGAFRRVAEISDRFQHVGLIGESMGGCGALLFTRYAQNVSRVLSFSPQYSMSIPYILFDKNLSPIARKIKETTKSPLVGFSDSPIKERCQLVYGTTDWRDYIHASMYSVVGFPVTHIAGAGHLVASFLKRAGPENGLGKLITGFCDFSKDFSQQSISDATSSFRPETPLAYGCEPDAADNWEFRRANATAIPARPNFQNLALGKIATQSSISKWSKGRDVHTDASGAINGEINGTFGFHTGEDQCPWWQVDLVEKSLIHEIRLFNRMENFEVASRAAHFEVRISEDGSNWRQEFVKTDRVIFGGVDGHPFIIRCVSPVVARFVQIRLKTRGYLHLDQVEVYGTVGIEASKPASIVRVQTHNTHQTTAATR